MRTFMLVAIPLILSLVSGCCPTLPKTGGISGSVELINDTGNASGDPVDHSGVIIALYELATPDTTLLRLNNLHPSVGVLVNQETEFDHRGASPVKTVNSQSDGSFTLPEVEAGSYNLVIMKESWGLRYVYDITVSAGDVLDVGNLALFPIRTFGSTVLDDVVLESDHTYIIENDVNFIGSVTFNPRAWIFANPNCMIKFFGEIVTPPEDNTAGAWKIVSAKNLYSTVPDSIGFDDYFTSVSFYAENPVIRSGIIHHVSNAVALFGAQCEISNVLLRHCGNGFVASQGSLSLTNTVIAYGPDDDTNVGVYIQNTSGHSEITNSIFIKMYEALVIDSPGSFSISNCYIYANYRGIKTLYCAGDISNNTFHKNTFDISPQYGHNSIGISLNNFFQSGHTSLRPIGRATVNNNNFYSTSYHFINIYSAGMSDTNSTVPEDLDATLNYWAVPDVDPYLYDALDDSEHPQYPCAFVIRYLPKRSTPVLNAGIQ